MFCGFSNRRDDPWLKHRPGLIHPFLYALHLKARGSIRSCRIRLYCMHSIIQLFVSVRAFLVAGGHPTLDVRVRFEYFVYDLI